MKQACDFLSDEARIAPGFTLSSAERCWCLLRAFQAVSVPRVVRIEVAGKGRYRCRHYSLSFSVRVDSIWGLFGLYFYLF